MFNLKNSTWKILMEEVHVHCCESVAENDTSGLAADSFSSLTELPFPRHRCGGVCAHMHPHSQSSARAQARIFFRCCSAFLFASGQIICFPCICVLFGQLAKDTDAASGQLPSAKSISMCC